MIAMSIGASKSYLRDSLNHFKSISKTPDTALEEISLERTAIISSTMGSVPSSLSASWPFARPSILAEEFGLVLRFPGPSPGPSSPNEIPFWPFWATRAETLPNKTRQSTITRD